MSPSSLRLASELLDQVLAAPPRRRPSVVLGCCLALAGSRAASLWRREPAGWTLVARAGDLEALPRESAVQAALPAGGETLLVLGQRLVRAGHLAVALDAPRGRDPEEVCDVVASLLAVASAVDAADEVPAPLPSTPERRPEASSQLRALLDAVDCHRSAPGPGSGRVRVTLEGDLLGTPPSVAERPLFALVRGVLRALDTDAAGPPLELRCRVDERGAWQLTARGHGLAGEPEGATAVPAPLATLRVRAEAAGARMEPDATHKAVRIVLPTTA